MLSSEVRPQYLDNLLLVAKADGVIHPAEQQVLDHLVDELKFKKRELTQAELRVDSKQAKAAIVGRLSEAIRMIEDVGLVCVADGALPPSEEDFVRGLLRSVGLDEALCARILEEAEARKAAILGGALQPCPACGTGAPANARFCLSCGHKLQAESATPVQVDIKAPDWGITIEFGESTSANFPAALEAAKKAPHYQEALRAKKKWHAATWPEEAIEEAAALAGLLSGWRSRNVYVRGELQTWDTVFGFMWCAQRRSSAYQPDTYCHLGENSQLNIWGCLQSQMEWTRWSRWFSYGSFEDPRTFRFDKEQIKHELEQHLHRYRLCPHLNRKYVDAVLALFPGKVTVDGRTWDYLQSYEDAPGAITIKRKRDVGGYAYEDEIRVNGVRPLGFDLASQLLAEGRRRSGAPPLALPALTER